MGNRILRALGMSKKSLVEIFPLFLSDRNRHKVRNTPKVDANTWWVIVTWPRSWVRWVTGQSNFQCNLHTASFSRQDQKRQSSLLMAHCSWLAVDGVNCSTNLSKWTPTRYINKKTITRYRSFSPCICLFLLINHYCYYFRRQIWVHPVLTRPVMPWRVVPCWPSGTKVNMGQNRAK